MISKFKAAILGGMAICMLNFQVKAQSGTIKPSLFEGIAVAGYVDGGAFMNFVGPSVKYTSKPVSIMFGMLPSLKLKEDRPLNGAPKNAMLMSSLAFGLTVLYDKIAFQVPAFYTAKTSTTNGKWHAGIGIGYKF